MLKFRFLQVKDRPQFKDQFFDLSKPGIHLVLGHNLKTGSNNGVGKSLFFGELPSFITGDSFGSVAQSDKTRQGSVTFGVTRGKDDFDFERSFEKRERIRIIKNGADLEVKDLAVAREKMAEIVPYKEEEVSSFLYLDLANGVHPLITGSTAKRKEFFRRFFRSIDALGEMRKLVDSHSSSIRASERRLSEVRTTLRSLKESLPEGYQDLPARISDMEERQSEVQKTALEVSRAITLRSEIERLSNPNVEVPEDLESEISRLKLKLKDLRKQIRVIERYEEWSESVKDIEAELSKLKEDLSSLPEYSKEEEESIASRLDEDDELRSEYEKSKDIHECRLTSISEETDLIERRVIDLSKNEKVCPTCGGEYENLEVKKLLRKNSLRLKELRAELSTIVQPEEPTLLSAKKRTLLEDKLAGQRLSKKLGMKLRAMSVPDEPEKPTMSRSKVEKSITRTTALLETAEEQRALSALLEEWKSIPRDIRKRASGSGAMDELISLGNELSDLRVSWSKVQTTLEDIKELRVERKSLAEKAQDSEACSVLTEAFSPNGVRREMISDVCGLLNDHINSYASFAFSEDFKFEFELDTQFSITVTRRFGKKTHVSDVRRLSGAEKRLFSLVLVPALISFLRPADRPSVLILDEPTATMGEDNKASFVRLLPILNKVIPTIIVITPLKPHDYVGIDPRVWTVVKDGPQSTIESGIIDANSQLHSKRKPKLDRSSGRVRTSRSSGLPSKSES